MQAWKVSKTQRYGALSTPATRLHTEQITHGLHQTRSRPDDGRRLRSGLPRLDISVEGIGSSQPTAGSSNSRHLNQTRTRPGGGLRLRSGRSRHVSVVAESGTAAV